MNDGASPVRVVIADDEDDVRLLLRIQLEHEGFEIAAEATDGKSALDRCHESEPDAIVLDLLMPGVNGFEAIPLLRRQLPHVQIVAYTAVAGDFVRKEMARMRIPLLLKSGNITALATTLREITAG